MSFKVTRIVGGVLKTFTESGTGLPTIYDQTITIVASNPGTNELVGPIPAGTNITLPGSATYDGQELEIYVNGVVLDDILDFNFVGSPPRTQVQFTFDLEIGDKIRFRKIRDE